MTLVRETSGRIGAGATSRRERERERERERDGTCNLSQTDRHTDPALLGDAPRDGQATTVVCGG